MVVLDKRSLCLVSSVCLSGFCLGADYILFTCESRWSKVPHGETLRAVSDSLVHGLVGGWCWVNVLLVTQADWSGARLLQVALCVAVAAGMDLDHMIEARSLRIKDALNLSHRPFAHNTCLIPLLTAALYGILYLFPPLKQHSLSQDLPVMFAVAILSHHLRDADRRGMWFAPFGSTPAIPHKLYVVLVALLPVCVAAVPMAARRLCHSIAAFICDTRSNSYGVYNV